MYKNIFMHKMIHTVFSPLVDLTLSEIIDSSVKCCKQREKRSVLSSKWHPKNIFPIREGYWKYHRATPCTFYLRGNSRYHIIHLS